MRSATQIHDPRPLREKLPKGLDDFQRVLEISEVNFSVATPSKVATPLPGGHNPLTWQGGRIARISPSRNTPKLTTSDPDRLLSTCRAGFRVSGIRPIRSPTQIHNRRPLRKKFPEGLGDFQRFWRFSKSSFWLRPPYQVTSLIRSRMRNPFTSDPLIKRVATPYRGVVSPESRQVETLQN